MRRLLCLAAAALLGSACTTPPPRVPFNQGSGWHLIVVGGTRETTDRYIGDHPVVGLDFVLEDPTAPGWSWEAGFRYGDGDGVDTYYERRPGNDPPDIVDVERTSEFYEIALGVRQSFWLDLPVQPYFGLGATLIKSNSADRYPEFDDGTTTFPARTDHFHKTGVGIYGRTGLTWRVLRDQIREDSAVVIALDLRGMYGDDISFVELTLGMGYGR